MTFAGDIRDAAIDKRLQEFGIIATDELADNGHVLADISRGSLAWNSDGYLLPVAEKQHLAMQIATNDPALAALPNRSFSKCGSLEFGNRRTGRLGGRANVFLLAENNKAALEASVTDAFAPLFDYKTVPTTSSPPSRPF
jgi:hypothetical protein